MDGSVEVCIDVGLEASLGEGELSNPLDLITDTDTPATKDAFISVSFKERRKVVHGKNDWFPRIEGILHSILIDKIL
jgi:hypothetical protein